MCSRVIWLYIYISILFQILFHYRLLQYIKYSSLCYTVGPCWLSIFFFYYFIFFGCVGSSFLCEGFLQLQQAGATPHHGARGLSLSWPLLLRSTGSRCAGSVVVAHGPSCSAACGIFPDQGLNPCPLHWQADSQPLRHQGSPIYFI